MPPAKLSHQGKCIFSQQPLLDELHLWVGLQEELWCGRPSLLPQQLPLYMPCILPERGGVANQHSEILVLHTLSNKELLCDIQQKMCDIKANFVAHQVCYRSNGKISVKQILWPVHLSFIITFQPHSLHIVSWLSEGTWWSSHSFMHFFGSSGAKD